MLEVIVPELKVKYNETSFITKEVILPNIFGCKGCEFYAGEFHKACTDKTPCDENKRSDKKYVIWVKET